MQVSMDFGQIALIIVQIIMLTITFFVHGRQLSALDIEKRDRGTFGAKVTEALRAANDALMGIEKIDKELYRDLARKHALLLQDVEDLKVKNGALEESVKSLANKLASRDRADALAAKRPPQPIMPTTQEPAPVMDPGQDPLEFLKAQGLALPIAANPSGHQQLAPNGRVNMFGKSVIGGPG